MPVSGLVVSVSEQKEAVSELQSWLTQDARFDLGEIPCDAPRKWPLVIDSASKEEDQQLWAQLNDHPGVVHLDVVFVSFEDGATSCPSGVS